MPIPEQLQPLWKPLRIELLAIHTRWIVFKQLFDHSDEQRQFLHEAAPLFFLILSGTLIDDIQLALARMSDPPSNKHQKNATFRTLLCEIGALGHDSLAHELKETFARFKSALRPYSDT